MTLKSIDLTVFESAAKNIYADGFNEGFSVGSTKNQEICYRDGYEEGHSHGYEEGRAEGYNEGHYDRYMEEMEVVDEVGNMDENLSNYLFNNEQVFFINKYGREIRGVHLNGNIRIRGGDIVSLSEFADACDDPWSNVYIKDKMDRIIYLNFLPNDDGVHRYLVRK